MNYKKLIIILLILYILYNCFKLREGLIIGRESYSKEGDRFRKKFCNLISKKGKKVNITNFNYNKVHLCKDFTYDNFKDVDMEKCSDKVAKVSDIHDKNNNNYFKNIEKIKNKQLFNPDEIKTIMNCRLINELNIDDKELRKQFITNIYEDEFSEKEPITNFKILSSYNSSCVYLDDSKEVHDLDQITFLFNLGVRYFDFCVVQSKQSDDFIISSEPKDATLKDDSIFINLENTFKTIYDNKTNNTITNMYDLTSIEKLYENLSPGSPSYNTPLIIHLKICINFNDLLKSNNDDNTIKNVFNSIYNKILGIITTSDDESNSTPKEQRIRDNFYLDGSVKNQKTQSKNGKLITFLNVSIDKLKNKIILLVDYLSYNKKIIENKSELEKQTINKAFNNSRLSEITSMVVNERGDGDLNTELTPNYKRIKKSNESISDDTISINHFYILNPADPHYGKKNQKKGTYNINTVQNFNNGVNVTAFPFYLVKNKGTDTYDNFVNYYNLFNSEDNASSLKRKNNDLLTQPPPACVITDNPIDKSINHNNFNQLATTAKDSTNKKNTISSNFQKKYFNYTIKKN